MSSLVTPRTLTFIEYDNGGSFCVIHCLYVTILRASSSKFPPHSGKETISFPLDKELKYHRCVQPVCQQVVCQMKIERTLTLTTNGRKPWEGNHLTAVLGKPEAYQAVEMGRGILLIFLSSAIYIVKKIKEGESSSFLSAGRVVQES